jgi:cell division protein FtsB
MKKKITAEKALASLKKWSQFVSRTAAKGILRITAMQQQAWSAARPNRSIKRSGDSIEYLLLFYIQWD